MDATEWERQFEDAVARERELMIALLDAARAVTGAFRPSGVDAAGAAEAFRDHAAQWRSAADAVAELAERCPARQ